MGTPPWLYDVFAVVMLVVAAYGAILLVLSTRPGARLGRDVDIAHVLMGVAMAGMFEPTWTFWPNWFWEAAFFTLLVWFLARSAQSIQRYGVHLPHETIHAAMSFAMLLMYWFPMATPKRGPATSMSMSVSTGSHVQLDSGIGLLLITAFLGSAVFTLAAPVRGLSHHGSHLPQRARVAVGAAAAGGASAAIGASANGSGPGAETDTVLLEPWLLDLSHVAMSVAMGFMLVLML